MSVSERLVSPSSGRVLPPPDVLRLEQLGRGFQVSQAMYAAVRLGLPELIPLSGATSAELAAMSGASAAALARLLRTLAAVGLVREVTPDRFVLLDTAAALRADHQFSIRPRLLFWGSRNMWDSWGSLVECVRTGRTANAMLHGSEDPESYRDRHPQDAALFHEAMTARVHSIAVALPNAHDFSHVRRVVDVGGGHGHLMIQLLLKHPTMTGVVFDLPDVVHAAKQAAILSGVGDRLEVVGGNVFEHVPGGADVYVMSGMLQNWSDDRARTALERVRDAMVGPSRLLIIDSLQPEPDEQSAAAQIQVLDDLTMLVRTGGRGRRASEFRELLAMAGLHVTNVRPVGFVQSIIEAVPRA